MQNDEKELTFKEYFYLIEGIISNIDLNVAYELFKKEYEERTGYAWPLHKFLSRARNWEFWGDEKGYVAIRRQRSGYIKLVGAAGSNKSKYIAIKELLALGEPIWGVVTEDIFNLALKVGMRAPTEEEKSLMMVMIPDYMMSSIDSESNKVTVNYKDVGQVEKYFIANEEYYNKVKTQLE